MWAEQLCRWQVQPASGSHSKRTRLVMPRLSTRVSHCGFPATAAQTVASRDGYWPKCLPRVMRRAAEPRRTRSSSDLPTFRLEGDPNVSAAKPETACRLSSSQRRTLPENTAGNQLLRVLICQIQAAPFLLRVATISDFARNGTLALAASKTEYDKLPSLAQNRLPDTQSSTSRVACSWGASL